jgi:hypothetical protein
MKIKRAVVAVAVVGLINLVAWGLGFDFDHRGLGLGMLIYASGAAAVLTYFCPAWDF